MATLTSGALRQIRSRHQNWGGSCVLRACDDALAGAGVRRGDYVVVARGSVPQGDALVVVQGENGKGGSKEGERLLLRTLQRCGPRVRLQPGSGPLRPVLLPPEQAAIWGTVVAVLRKMAT